MSKNLELQNKMYPFTVDTKKYTPTNIFKVPVARKQVEKVLAKNASSVKGNVILTTIGTAVMTFCGSGVGVYLLEVSSGVIFERNAGFLFSVFAIVGIASILSLGVSIPLFRHKKRFWSKAARANSKINEEFLEEWLIDKLGEKTNPSTISDVGARILKGENLITFYTRSQRKIQLEKKWGLTYEINSIEKTKPLLRLDLENLDNENLKAKIQSLQAKIAKANNLTLSVEAEHVVESTKESLVNASDYYKRIADLDATEDYEETFTIVLENLEASIDGVIQSHIAELGSKLAAQADYTKPRNLTSSALSLPSN